MERVDHANEKMGSSIQWKELVVGSPIFLLALVVYFHSPCPVLLMALADLALGHKSMLHAVLV